MSLRARLVLGMVVVMAFGLVVAGASGVALLRSYQLQRLDQQISFPLGNSYPPDSGLAEDGAKLCELLSSAPGPQQLPTSFALLVLGPDGSQLCRLPAEPGGDGAPDLRPGSGVSAAEVVSRGTHVTVPSTNGSSSWRVGVAATPSGFLVVAASLADADATVARLARIEAAVGLGILALTALVGQLVVRIGLAPLTAIEGTAVAIAGGDLSSRVAPRSVRTEIGRLGAALNAMLGQIEEAFDSRTRSEDRLRQFVADASHELRTPLATIRGHAELYRQGVATGPEDVSLLLRRIESESVRMGVLVEDLLLLARLDAAPALQRHPVDLLSLAADAVVDTHAQDPGRSVVLRRLLEPPWLDEPPEIDADPARVRQILMNLLSNALRYTPPGSPVQVEVGVQPSWVHLHVVDHGPGLAPEVAPRVFERFYREDAGRDRQSGGVGLGLSIVDRKSVV